MTFSHHSHVQHRHTHHSHHHRTGTHHSHHAHLRHKHPAPGAVHYGTVQQEPGQHPDTEKRGG